MDHANTNLKLKAQLINTIKSCPFLDKEVQESILQKIEALPLSQLEALQKKLTELEEEAIRKFLQKNIKTAEDAKKAGKYLKKIELI